MTARAESRRPVFDTALALALRLVAGLAALGLSIWIGFLPLGAWLAPLPPLAPVALVSVEESGSNGEGWLAGLLSGQRWFADTQDETSRTFRLTIPDHVGSDETLYLWVPHFEQRLVVLTGSGHLLHDSIVVGLRGGPIRNASALVPLPPEVIRASGGVLLLNVQANLNRIGAPGPVYVAQWEDLSASVHILRLLENTVRPAMFGALMFLAVMSVGFVILRGSDPTYYWLSGTMIPYAIVETGLITAYFPALAQVDDRIFAASGIGSLQMIGLLLTFKSRRPTREMSMGLFALYLVLVVATFFMSKPALVQISALMALGTALLSALFLVFFAIETGPERRLIDLALTVSLIMFIAGIVHDLLLKFGAHESGVYVFRYVSFIMLTGIFGIVVQRQSGIADALDRSAVRLQHRLEEQEKKLAEYHRREAATLQSRAAETERQRITADLHDGMAGYLATIVALSEHDNPDDGEISNLAKDALNDLRFVIDATSMSSPELRVTLAILRERCLQPLDALGIELSWSMIDLPDDVHLSHEGNLQVLRILQEALNNSVRHGKPKTIDVTGRAIAHDNGAPWIELVLENRGGKGHDPGHPSRGFGTTNMINRAKALGGQFELVPLPDGARARLTFPAHKQG